MIVQRFKEENGMGLLEVLVGMIILAIGLLGLAPMIVTSIDANVTARDHSEASNLVKQKMEYYESLDPMPAVPFSEHETDVASQYDRTVSIEDNTCDTLIPDGVYEVVVTVSWTDIHNVQRSTSLSTFVLKN